MTFAAEKTFTVEGIRVPDTRLVAEITQFVRDTESALLFHHSSRVYYWGALAGTRRGLQFDRELLYAGAMFHDLGLTPAHSTHERFEVDARTPPATSSAVTALTSRTSIRSGRRSLFTPRPASRSTCTPSSLW
jgi:HD superfamily phosphodiesterase